MSNAPNWITGCCTLLIHYFSVPQRPGWIHATHLNRPKGSKELKNPWIGQSKARHRSTTNDRKGVEEAHRISTYNLVAANSHDLAPRSTTISRDMYRIEYWNEFHTRRSPKCRKRKTRREERTISAASTRRRLLRWGRGDGGARARARGGMLEELYIAVARVSVK